MASMCRIKDWRKSVMPDRSRFWAFATSSLLVALWLLALALPVVAADSILAVDRGLPQANLNNASGTARSNVRWGWHDHGFLGDDFTIGASGERWVIDSIRVWTVPGTATAKAAHLGEFYEDVRLYLGSASKDLTPVAT